MSLKEALQDIASFGRAWRDLRADRRAGPDLRDRERGLRQQAYVQALHPRRMQLQVSELVQETRSTRSLRLKRCDGELPPFRPGQYINLFVELDGVLTSRPYSISSAPGEPHLDLTVREKPGGFVSPQLVRRVEVGQRFESTGPIGHFVHEPLIHGDQLVLLAGGSGITPFMSMLRDQERRGWPHTVTLLLGSRSRSDVIFGQELRKLARGNARFELAIVISEPTKSFRGRRGLLDAARIRREVGDVGGKTFFLCGPTPMLALCQEALQELGVPRQRILQELFGAPDDVCALDGWPEGVAADDVFQVAVGSKRLSAPAAEPLMNALERHGVVIPAACRSGECSACRTRLLSGRVFTPPQARVRFSDQRLGFIHPCMSYAISDLELRI